MQFVYRLGVVVIGTATFLASAFAITMAAFVLTNAPSGKIGGDVLIAVPCAALITWCVVKVWRWVCGQDTSRDIDNSGAYTRQRPARSRMTAEETLRFNAIIDKTSRKPLSPENVVGEQDLAWIQQWFGDRREGRELLHLIRQSNILNTLKPEDVAEFVEKNGRLHG